MVFMLNSSALAPLTFVTVVSVLVTASYGRVMVGKKTDMGDLRRNKEVQELGRFLADEYNERVIGVAVLRNDAVFANAGDDGEVRGGKKAEAKKQVVEGKYYLKVWALDENGRYREFDSVVEVKPWLSQNAKELLSFAPSQCNRSSDQKEEDHENDVVRDESVSNNKKF